MWEIISDENFCKKFNTGNPMLNRAVWLRFVYDTEIITISYLFFYEGGCGGVAKATGKYNLCYGESYRRVPSLHVRTDRLYFRSGQFMAVKLYTALYTNPNKSCHSRHAPPSNSRDPLFYTPRANGRADTRARREAKGCREGGGERQEGVGGLCVQHLPTREGIAGPGISGTRCATAARRVNNSF